MHRMHLDPSQRGRKISAGTREDGTQIFIQEDPLPRGADFKDVRPGKEDPAELDKLEATRKLGGLVPERSEFLDRLARMLDEQNQVKLLEQQAKDNQQQ